MRGLRPDDGAFTATLAGRPPAEVGAEVRAFLDGTGAQPAQMSGTARVCLGIGYSTDNAELAVGSALVLAALGEPAYGELVGYQVVTGAGLPSDCACGLDWMQASVDALDAGARPLVGDPAGDRTAMLAAAIGALRTPDRHRGPPRSAPARPMPGVSRCRRRRQRRPADRDFAASHPGGPLLEGPPVRSWRNW